MRLFGYYAVHSFANQLKKLLKTWVLIFILACVVLGVGIGIFAAALGEKTAEQKQTPQEEETVSMFEATGVSGNDLTELIVSGMALGMFALMALLADRSGGKVFLAADVNLLFASPMAPQSVLMFRLACQLGMALIATIWMIFQLPNLVLNLGLSWGAALCLLVAWGCIVFVSSLLQVMLYVAAASRENVKQWIRRVVYGVLLVAAGGFGLFLRRCGETPFKASVLFFNSPVSRWLPFWGWIKGFTAGALEGSAGKALGFLALNLAGSAALIWFIRRMKADFYEDAMTKAEETAELLERAKSEKRGFSFVRAKGKERSEKLARDGFRRGSGANVFFFKAIYNRFRFAHFHVLTKTMETYLAAGLGVAALCRFAFDSVSLLPAALTVCALAFFRTLGNPLEQDTKMDFFTMIPESTWSKLLWSLLGGTANCVLDVLPGLVGAALLLGANPLEALAWTLFAASVDFYGTNVGAFIGLSVPANAGKNLKQIVQILFIYFGLLPDAVILALGLTGGRAAPAILIAAAVNLAIGFLFFGLTPLFIDPCGGKPRRQRLELTDDLLAAAKKAVSRVGFGLVLDLVLANGLALGLTLLLKRISPDWKQQDWLLYGVSVAPFYVSLLGCWLVLRHSPGKAPEARPFGVKSLLCAGAISIFVMYAGSIVGSAVTGLLGLIKGGSVNNAVETLVLNSGLLPRLLFIVILSPLAEECLYRKLLLDRLRVYGERWAILLGAVLFGLFHGNLSQFFYAFGVGLVLGYVYLRSGRLRYSVILHTFINLLGSVVAPAMLSLIQSEELTDLSDLSDLTDLSELTGTGVLPMAVYVLVMIALSLLGLVLLCIRGRRLEFDPACPELTKRQHRILLRRPGLLLFMAGCAGLIVYSVVQ